MQSNYRLTHNRFYQGRPVFKGEKYDRVVSSVWTFDPENSILTYGSTVYRKNGKNDHWMKKKHREQAIKRFKENPIRVVLKMKFPKELEELKEQEPYQYESPELSNICMDWYIARKLIFKFGTHNERLDVRRIHGDVTIPYNFNDRYSVLASRTKYNDLSGLKNLEDVKDLHSKACLDFLSFFVGVGLMTFGSVVYFSCFSF